MEENDLPVSSVSQPLHDAPLPTKRYVSLLDCFHADADPDF